MITAFSDAGWNDYLFWQQNNPEVIEKIHLLIKNINRDPFKGLGKPEPLRGNLAGLWSRRITDEHRLVYKVSGSIGNQTITIVQARFYY